MTKNDQRVLDAVECACGKWDGFAPHGTRDWTAIRRLEAAGLVRHDCDGVCQTCPEPHDAAVFVLTSGAA